MFRLETERLIMRPWSDADRPAFERLSSDPRITQYIHAGTPYTPEEVDEFFTRQARQVAEHDVCMGAMCDRKSGNVIGIAGIQPLGTTGDLEIGWWVTPELWGRGLATEAGEAAMRHVLDTLGRKRVVAIIDPDNTPSKRVAERLGMTLEARVTGAQLGHRRPEIVVDLFTRLSATLSS